MQTDSRIDEIKELATTDTLLAELIQMVRNYADSALEAPVVKYEFDGPDNPRLKAQRRAAMFRVFNCGLTYMLTGDTIYAHRAKLDLLAPPDFPDWASWIMDSARGYLPTVGNTRMTPGLIKCFVRNVLENTGSRKEKELRLWMK